MSLVASADVPGPMNAARDSALYTGFTFAQ
jgi:hypothetical protein